jgi:hypothetical protein
VHPGGAEFRRQHAAAGCANRFREPAAEDAAHRMGVEVFDVEVEHARSGFDKFVLA